MGHVVGLAKIAVVLLGLGLVFSFLGRLHFMLDNLSSFRVHFAAGFVVLALLFALGKSGRWLIGSAAGLTVALVTIIPWYLPSRSPALEGPAVSMTVVSANVSPRNRDPRLLTTVVDAESIDLLGLVEITPMFLEQVRDLTDSYAYRYERPEEGFWGLALYSQLPLTQMQLMYFGEESPAAIRAIVDVYGMPLEAILVHPFPPMSAELAERRNRQLAALAEHVAAAEQPVVVLGDFNVAVWSPYHRDFVRRSGLVNARISGGVTPTWPAVAGLGVPIDHVFVTPPAVPGAFRVLPSVGSDHFAVAATLSWPQNQNHRLD